MRHHGLLALAFIALQACGGDVTPTLMDAGADAFVPVDGGADAQVEVDASADFDGGTVNPITSSRNEAYQSLMMVELARDAIDASMRVDALNLANDLLVGRLDAIIGEEGLVFSAGIIGEEGSMTALALPTSAVPTIVIVRQLAIALGTIADLRSGWGASTDPLIVTLVAALGALETDLAALETLLQARFREIIETIAVPTETVLTDYQDLRTFSLVPHSASFHVIAEGSSAADPTATLTWSCSGVDALAIRITNDETGALVLDLPSASPSSTAQIPLIAEHASSLRIEVTDPFISGAGYETCDFALTGRRTVRGTRFEVFGGELTELGTRSGDVSGRLAMIAGTFGSLRSGTSMELPVAEVIETYLNERLALAGRWRAIPRTAPAYVEDDLEVARLELIVLDAVGAALESSPQLTIGTGLVASTRGDLVALRAHDAAALLLLAEGDTAP